MSIVDKYKSVVEPAKHYAPKDADVHEENGKLIVRGTTEYQLGKDMIWDEIKKQAGWENEVQADIRVEKTDIYGIWEVQSGDSLSNPPTSVRYHAIVLLSDGSGAVRSSAERRRVLGTLNEAQARWFVADKALDLGRGPGHSIGYEVHGNGVNIDNLETRDQRRIIPGVCFSIESGVYLPEFGVRSELDMYVGEGRAEVTGGIQREMLLLA